MARLLFAKYGNAIWISHLDLMRLFQRSFKRAGLLLQHTQGFNPRPSVSIALPMSVGMESCCELLDFALEGETVEPDSVRERLNCALPGGVEVLQVYPEGRKLKYLSLMDCKLFFEYDNGIPDRAEEQLFALFQSPELIVEKRNKNGVSQQNIIPMIREIRIGRENGETLVLTARICCQNPTLNPMQISQAVGVYLPKLQPDHVRCCRMEILDDEENIFR